MQIPSRIKFIFQNWESIVIPLKKIKTNRFESFTWSLNEVSIF